MVATRTMLTASWSLQRADHGEQPYWALILLAACLGQISLPGGGFGFGYGSSGGIAEPPLAFRAPVTEILSNPLARAIPAARIADCLLRPGCSYDFNGRKGSYPDIRLVYWAGGNPFHHHQDLNRLRSAWRRPETIIVHEPWWTATARHADIVLPANNDHTYRVCEQQRSGLSRSREQPHRPGGNVTGVSILNQELESTRLERLVEVVPHATTIAFLVNPESLTADPKLREMENTARMFNRHLQVLNARSENEFEQTQVLAKRPATGCTPIGTPSTRPDRFLQIEQARSVVL